MKLMRSYQLLQILTHLLNSEVEKIWFGFHHASLLAMPVICFFVSIRWTDSVSGLTVGVLVMAGESLYSNHVL